MLEQPGKNIGRSPLFTSMALATGGMLAARAIYRRLHRIDLDDKVVLITGGTRGLGLVLAREFAGHGARIAICSRDLTDLEWARGDLLPRAREVYTSQCDITDESRATEMVQNVQRHFGRIDVLVNNAGMITVGAARDMTIQDFRDAMAVNFWGAVYTTLAALPAMRERRSGRIVNISSIGGKIPVPHLLPYSASKFAIVGFSEGLRAECAREGIVVTTVCPGLMRTGSPRNADFKGQHRKEFAWFSNGDSLPGAAMSVRRAARKIVDAARHGDGEVILTLPAKLAIKVHGLLTNTSLKILTGVNSLLPSPGGNGSTSFKGYESFSEASPSVLTSLTQDAEKEYNQL